MILRNWVLTIWVQIRDLYLYFFRHAIIVNGYVDDHTWKGIRHRNWGDDLNYYFLRELTGRPVVFYHNFWLAKWLHFKNYLCIGTLLDAVDYANAQTIVWGSGVSGKERSFVHPQNIVAVRGPMTKVFCDRYKVLCPEIYGDPALLLPLVYQPKKKVSPSALPRMEGTLRRYRLGIIPNVFDLKHHVIKQVRNEHANEVLIIDMSNYNCWTDIIDQICSCELILSSSLHGLIVSDLYGVRNIWISLSGDPIVGSLKFLDYVSSVKRQVYTPVKISNYADIENLSKDSYSCADYNVISHIQDGLLRVSPFQLSINTLTFSDYGG